MYIFSNKIPGPISKFKKTLIPYVGTCVTYGRTPNGQTELLQWDNKLRRNVNETTKIALTYG